MPNTCGWEAFICACQILTEQRGSITVSACCVEVTRVFFVLWFIKLAEAKRAVQDGYLAKLLKKRIDDGKNSRAADPPVCDLPRFVVIILAVLKERLDKLNLPLAGPTPPHCPHSSGTRAYRSSRRAGRLRHREFTPGPSAVR